MVGSSQLNITISILRKLQSWKLTALHVTQALQAAYPQEIVTLLGADICYVHRVKAPHRDLTRPLRTAAAFLILCLGGALGLAWFHADVNMPQAQYSVFEALTGEKPRDDRLITIPYAAGVALGVAVFYALPSKRATTVPRRSESVSLEAYLVFRLSRAL